ncbi:MAG: hypothetical protein Kow0037_03750 [Calditrichia bacterium]
MNDLIALLVIWVIITIFNQIFKKKEQKGADSPAPAKPGQAPPPVAKPQIPPFLQDLLGIPEVDEEEVEEAPAEPPAKKISGREDTELYKTETILEQPVIVEGQPSLYDIKTEEPEQITSGMPVRNYEITRDKPSRAKSLLQKYSLQEAFILKEILDEPISQKIMKQGHPLPNRKI